MKNSDEFRSKMIFLDRVSSAKNIANGYQNDDWKNMLRDEQRKVKENNTWKTYWEKEDT